MTASPSETTQAERFAEFCRSQDADGYAASCRAAVEADPGNVTARLAHAQAIGHCGDYDTRLEMLRVLVADHPHAMQPNIALGLELMSRGRYREGWPFYAHRNRATAKVEARRGLHADRQWQGQPLAGKTVLVHREQGLGDTLHFVRNVIYLQRIGARTVLDVQGGMRTLLMQSPALGHVLSDKDRATPNYWVRMLDLVPAITPTVDDVRWPGAYVAAPAEFGILRDLAAGPGLRVGLAWAGNSDFAMDAFRSMPLRALAPLADVPGCRFFSLLPEAATAEIGEAGATGWLTDLSGVSQPFDRLAAVIAHMDVVVTVCTSIAHLAGAMGKPVCLMLSSLGEWRWGRRGGATAWYPSMRLFRQRRLADWGPVVEDVAAALAAL